MRKYRWLIFGYDYVTEKANVPMLTEYSYSRKTAHELFQGRIIARVSSKGHVILYK